jgi:hypothetical protein
MRYIALVEDTAEEVHKDGNDADDGEDGSRANSLLSRFCSDTGGFGENFEVVRTFVWVGSNECGNCLSCERVLVAVEGNYG